jgi:hypothetical protein
MQDYGFGIKLEPNTVFYNLSTCYLLGFLQFSHITIVIRKFSGLRNAARFHNSQRSSEA